MYLWNEMPSGELSSSPETLSDRFTYQYSRWLWLNISSQDRLKHMHGMLWYLMTTAHMDYQRDGMSEAPSLGAVH